MNLLKKLNCRNPQQLREIISEHLKSLFENADWNYSSELTDYKRYYTETGLQQLLETVRLELAELLKTEKEGYTIYFGLSAYYSQEVMTLTKHDFENKASTEKLCTSNSSKPNNNFFFNEIKNSLNKEKRCVPQEIVQLIAEYALNEHDIFLISKISDTIANLNIQVSQLQCASKSNEERLNSMINIFSASLKLLIQPYGNTESYLEGAKLMHFGISNYSIKETSLPLLSLEQQNLVIEITQILYYLLDWHNVSHFEHPFKSPLTKSQINIYGLKAHIESPNSNAVIRKLFEPFFNYALPLMPAKINKEDLQETHTDSEETLGSYWYNQFLYKKYYRFFEFYRKRPILISMDSQNYLEVLDGILNSSLDPLKQFALIEHAWEEVHQVFFRSSSPRKFIMFLNAHAKRGNIAASNWITTAEQYDICFISDNAISKIYQDIAIDDLFKFIANAAQLNFGFTLALLPLFAKNLATYMAQYDIDNLVKNMLNYFSENARHDFLSIKIMIGFLGVTKEYHPELLDQFTPIQTHLIKDLTNLQLNEHINPICRNSKVFETMIQELSALFEVNNSMRMHV